MSSRLVFESLAHQYICVTRASSQILQAEHLRSNLEEVHSDQGQNLVLIISGGSHLSNLYPYDYLPFLFYSNPGSYFGASYPHHVLALRALFCQIRDRLSSLHRLESLEHPPVAYDLHLV